MAERRDRVDRTPRPTAEREDIPVLLLVGSAAELELPGSRRLVLVNDSLEIGRRGHDWTGTNFCYLKDKMVSSRHARITAVGQSYEITDLDSKNGTFVGDTPVDKRLPLRDGALVFVGMHAGVFRLVAPRAVEAINQEVTRSFGPIVTMSPAMALACERMRRLAPTEQPILLVAETGAGQEIFAREIHAHSGRRGPFITIDCADRPRQLFENELFGRQTTGGGQRAKAGLIKEAEGGTLFFDGIDQAQAKVLHFVKDREMTTVGSAKRRRIDARIIASAPRVTVPAKSGGGREDLAELIGAAPVHLPPLRDRLEDLGAWAAHFLKPTPGTTFDLPAFRAMCLHPWPSNLRELERVVAAAARRTEGRRPIGLDDLPVSIRDRVVGDSADARPAAGASPSPEELETLMKRYDGDVTQVSRKLGKPEAAVWRWLKKFGLGSRPARKR